MKLSVRRIQNQKGARKMDTAVIRLLESSNGITGQLQSGLNCLQHPEKTLLGNYRKAVLGENMIAALYDVDALASKLGLPHDAGEKVVSIHGDLHRRIKQSETQARVLALAGELQQSGVPDQQIGTRLSEILPFSRSYIDKLLPDHFKRRDLARSPGRPAKKVVFPGKPNCECCGLSAAISATPVCPECKRSVKLLSLVASGGLAVTPAQLTSVVVAYVFLKFILSRTIQPSHSPANLR